MTPHTNHTKKAPLASHYLRCASVLIYIALLSACSNYSTKQDIAPLLDKEAYVDIPDVWTIHAKLGIKNAEDSGSVTLNWEQVGENYTIQLSGPFGQGNAKLSGNRYAILIEQPGKKTLYSNNPKSLIQQAFGWDLPLEHLPYWIRGLQTPGSANDSAIGSENKLSLSNQAQAYTSASVQYDEAGTLSSLSQFGWDINYSRYKVQHQYLAPHRIRANNNDVTLTLIIKKWEFPSIAETTAGTAAEIAREITVESPIEAPATVISETRLQPTHKTAQQTIQQ